MRKPLSQFFFLFFLCLQVVLRFILSPNSELRFLSSFKRNSNASSYIYGIKRLNTSSVITPGCIMLLLNVKRKQMLTQQMEYPNRRQMKPPRIRHHANGGLCVVCKHQRGPGWTYSAVLQNIPKWLKLTVYKLYVSEISIPSGHSNNNLVKKQATFICILDTVPNVNFK